jgi:hypothetical protein
MEKPIKQDPEAWRAGYEAGQAGQAPPTPPGVDGLAFQAGVVEGRAARRESKKTA